MNRAGIIQCVIIFFVTLIMNIAGYAQERVQDIESEVTNNPNKTAYFYSTEGRFDPFKPFITQKSSSSITPDPNEIVDEENHLTGMQLFEPGQLTLVGVIVSSREPMALVEDQTKKGYILKLGNPVGKRGVVSSIEDKQIIITETAKTRAGKQLKTTTTMRLKKEGDA